MTRLPLPVPAPINPSYQPKTSISTIPASTPIGYILPILERDGGVILKDLVSQDELTSINEELKEWSSKPRRHLGSKEKTEGAAFPTIPAQTFLVPGLVGKSKTVAQICERPVLEELRQRILLDEFTVNRENFLEPNTIEPLLSVSMGIGYGAPRQLLHRDDNVHGIRHSRHPLDSQPWSFKQASQFGCLIAGCNITRELGATMFVPGSHKWGDDRVPRTDEVCFAGIYSRSVFIYFATYTRLKRMY